MKILIVDTDSFSRTFLRDAVQELGHETEMVEERRAALGRLAETEFDLILLALQPREGDASLDFVQVRETPVVMVGALASIDQVVAVRREGAVDFIWKPCSPDAIKLVLDRVVRTQRLEQENAYLREQNTWPIEEEPTSKGMQGVLAAAKRLGQTRSTVLITGEFGTGKKTVAAFIHRSSSRCDGPFIQVDCGVLSLMGSAELATELFGHEKGAFDGANKHRRGRFELAAGGTLLLEEVGAINPEMQTKLLRMLEECEFERAGGTQTHKVENVRVIGTTTKDLKVEVEGGRFREDLYYRLNVLPVLVPPLRDRAEDVPQLC